MPTQYDGLKQDMKSLFGLFIEITTTLLESEGADLDSDIESSLDMNEFDPVYKKQSHSQVRKAVHQALELNKKMMYEETKELVKDARQRRENRFKNLIDQE